jgi:hypothetical protein
MKRASIFDAAVMATALALFLSLSLYQVQLPGLYYDEAADAVLAMQMALGQPVELFRGAGLWVGGQAFPLMVMDYVGAVNSYLLVPFFALLGVGVFPLRLMPILGSALALVLTYALAKSLFGGWAAALATLLLAAHPSFVFWSRQGIYVTSIMAPIALGSLLALLQWHRRGNWPYLVLGLFLLGLGLSAKLLFLWFVAALALLYLLLRGRIRPLSLPLGLGGLGAFVLGAWMLILYNLQTQGTLTILSRNLLHTEQGVSNLALLPNLATRVGSFAVLLDGGFFWFLGGIFRSQVYPYAFVGAALALLVLLALPRFRSHRKGGLFVLGLILLIFLQSVITVSGLWPTHFFLLLPLVALILGLVASLLPLVLPWRRLGWALGLALFLGLFASSLGVSLQYHQALSRTGGLSAHSDAIYRLAQVLEQRGVPNPQAMDWGIKSSIQILTQGRVNPVEVFQYQPQPDQTFYDLVFKAMQSPRQLYIFRSPELTVYPRFEAFAGLAQRLGIEPVLEETVTQRDGKPLYLVYGVR